jgi:hypothetical protein
MVRFDDGLKTARCDPERPQKLEAIEENRLLTEDPTDRSTLNAAIEMKNATIAYSIAVAPP